MRHVLRREKHEPTYMLPKEHRQPSFTVAGSMPSDAVVERFVKRMKGRTGQAKARGSSVFWEGVLVLPDFSGDFRQYAQDVALRLQRWKAEYEKLTGHAVLHMTAHLDEGYMEDGEPRYNEHAHVQIDRVGPDGRLIRLGRAELSKVQDMTAEVLGLERGETLEQRGGKRGRKHMGHHEYRRFAAAQREAELNYCRGVDDGAEAVAADASRTAQMDAEAAKRREAYMELRGLLKGSGRASQAHYSALKRLHESRSENFGKLGEYVRLNDTPDVRAVLDYLSPPEPANSPTR